MIGLQSLNRSLSITGELVGCIRICLMTKTSHCQDASHAEDKQACEVVDGWRGYSARIGHLFEALAVSKQSPLLILYAHGMQTACENGLHSAAICGKDHMIEWTDEWRRGIELGVPSTIRATLCLAPSYSKEVQGRSCWGMENSSTLIRHRFWASKPVTNLLVWLNARNIESKCS